MKITETIDKLAVYAAALPADISARRHPLVVKGKLTQLYGGTVYGALVATDKGTTFATFDEAYANAMLFVQQCQEAMKLRETT